MRMYPENLWDRLSFLSEQGLRLSVDAIRLYAAELLFALENLHSEHRTFHCDLKPQNILIAPSGHLCLADFGLSIHCPDGPEMRAWMVPKGGTPHYWPPECYDAGVTQVNGVGLDTYALGRIFYKLFEGPGVAHFFDQGDGSAALDDLFSVSVSDPDGADLIRQMISVSPAKRPPLKELQQHVFFARIDWSNVTVRGYTPRHRLQIL
ncbi:kinase-like domain-containing protein [Mycena galericulata]|nr:kinase-like domain-containing protein [Mycena galericulata]